VNHHESAREREAEKVLQPVSQESPIPTILRPQQVAEILQISTKTVHALCRAGRLSYFWINAKERRFTADDVHAYLRACHVESSTVPAGRAGRARAQNRRFDTTPAQNLDTLSENPLPSVSKGGERQVRRKANHRGTTDRARLKEEFRSW
jgi:excisionase family DNA binding protein